MSLHAIDFPHLRFTSTSSAKQSLLYPTVAQITPTNNINSNDDSFFQEDEDDKHFLSQYSERTNKMSSASVQIANGSLDSSSSSNSNYRSKNQRQHQQQQQQQQQPIYVDIETMRMQLSSLVSKLQSRVSIDTVRPLHVFLGLNHNAGYCLSPTAFTPPVKLSTNKLVDKSAPEKIKSRVQLNFAYFISNYALLAIMTAIVIALMHPSMVFFVAIVYFLWMGHEFLIRHPLIVFGVEVHALLSIKQRFYFLFTMTSFVVVWKCLMPTIFFLSISSFLIITHSLLRDPKDVEASGSMSDRYNNGRESDDDEVDIEGGPGNDSVSGITTSLIDRAGVKSPGAEKRRNAVGNNSELLSSSSSSKQ